MGGHWMTHLAGGQAAGAADTVDAAQQEGHYAGLPKQQSTSETTMYSKSPWGDVYREHLRKGKPSGWFSSSG